MVVKKSSTRFILSGSYVALPTSSPSTAPTRTTPNIRRRLPGGSTTGCGLFAPTVSMHLFSSLGLVFQMLGGTQSMRYLESLRLATRRLARTSGITPTNFWPVENLKTKNEVGAFASLARPSSTPFRMILMRQFPRRRRIPTSRSLCRG